MDGIVIGVEENVAFRIRYQISFDLQWQVRKVMEISPQGKVLRVVANYSG